MYDIDMFFKGICMPEHGITMRTQRREPEGGNSPGGSWERGRRRGRGKWRKKENNNPPLCTTLICFLSESACPSTALQCGQGAFTYFRCPSWARRTWVRRSFSRTKSSEQIGQTWSRVPGEKKSINLGFNFICLFLSFFYFRCPSWARRTWVRRSFSSTKSNEQMGQTWSRVPAENMFNI